MKKILLGLLLGVGTLFGDTGYTLTVDSLEVSEGVGTAQVNIRVTPHNKETWSTGDQININFTTAEATTSTKATADADYVSSNNENFKIIPNSEGMAVINIPIEIIDDFVQQEPDEDFVLSINSATCNNDKWVILAEGGLITIIDNDRMGLPLLSINDIFVSEASAIAIFTVSLSGMTTTEDVTFKYSTRDGTATDGNDYIAKGESVTIPAGSDEIKIEVPLINDLIAEEGQETFSIDIVNLSSNVKLQDGQGIATIIDDDLGLTMSIQDATIAEKDIDSIAKIKIIFSEPLTDDLLVTYHTEENTARFGDDFTKIETAQVTIPSGLTDYNISVEIIGDNTEEGIEDFYLQIDSISGVNSPVLADSVSKITIFDDDASEACSSLIGLMTINEYQNNPHYFDKSGDKVRGNYVEIKYIDFLVKQFITDKWTISIYTNAGSQTLTWDQVDPNCVDPRYDVFQFDNEVMGSTGYIVLADENGNEVDVLNIYDSDHYAQKCTSFIYDTDFESSAQNKDLFRDPDGTGDWFDHGTGANSEGSRCENRDGTTGLLFTEFDALDIDEVTPKVILNNRNVPIKTKVANKDFSLKIISLDVTTGLLKNSTVEIKVFLADGAGAKLKENNLGVMVSFLNSNVVFRDLMKHNKSYRKVRLYFEYCIGDTGLENWNTCHGLNEAKSKQMRSHSRDMFALRPDKLILSNTTNDNFHHLLKAGESYNLAVEARDGSAGIANGYTIRDENYLPMLNISETKYFKDGTEDLGGVLEGISKVDTTQLGYMINGLSSVDEFTSGVAEEVVPITYSDVGKIKIEMYDKTWADVDYIDTPPDCTSPSHLYICGEIETTFIPDHFKIDSFKIKNNDGEIDSSTYVANDLENMSAKIEAKISAVNKNNEITKNFKTGDLYYENEVTVTPAIEIEDETLKDGYFYPVANVTKIENKKIGFGDETMSNDAGTKTILQDEIEDKLNFNFKRDNNRETNPFLVIGNYVSLKVESKYVDGAKETIVVGKVAGDKVDPSDCLITENCVTNNAENSVLFKYIKATSSKEFYDNIVGETINTPIIVYTYCDLDPVACGLYNIDLSKKTDKIDWWIESDHKESNGDGKVVLKTYSVIEGVGTPIVENPVVKVEASGTSDTASVKANATTRPMTTLIKFEMDDTLADYTNEWMVYNEESATADPEPFYKVRFITPRSGWTGIGETGNVVNQNSTLKRTKKMNW